jgi:hypothetical protein
VFLVAPFLGLPYGIWQVVRQKKEPQGQAEAPGDEGEAPAPAKVNYGTFVATLIGFACFLTAAGMARPEWSTTARLLLVAGIASMGVSFLFLNREEGEEAEEPEAQPESASASHEVPYGPFLGLAAGVVMLIQEYAVAHFRPGIEALLHAIAG